MKVEMQDVYHYTSLETFFKLTDGIKDNHFIFYATRILELNDKSELIYGFRKFWKLLPDIEKELKIDNDEYKLSKLSENESTQKDGLPQLIYNGLANSRHIPFVISFSNDKDNLPMWNMYANNGYGVALGFKMQFCFSNRISPNNSLIDLTAYDPLKPITLKMSYGNISKSSNIYRFAKILYSNYYSKVQGINDIKEILKKQLDLIEELGIAASVLLKHPSFSFEKESRYYCKVLDTDSINFRINARGNFIPFVEVPIPISMFKKIVIGPCRDINNIEDIISIRLKQKGLEGIKIEKSKIPYRNF